MRKIISESDIETFTLEILSQLGYTVLYGPDISEGGENEERKYDEVVLKYRLGGGFRKN